MDDQSNSTTGGLEKRPSPMLIHGAMILTMVLFGGGSVVGKLGLPGFNPVLFALIREGVAGPILCVLAYAKTRMVPDPRDWLMFVLPGFFLFLNQIGFIVGLKLSTSVTASAWQPSQPIFAATLGIMLGLETFNLRKFTGILIAIAGALFMVMYNHESGGDSKNELIGQICFFVNCSGTALYLLLSKKPMAKYPPIIVTGWCYITASVMMAVTASLINSFQASVDFVCPQGCSAWGVPVDAIWALAYWILAQSCVAYLCWTWANKYVDSSVSCSYSVLQPVTAAVLSTLLIVLGAVKKCSDTVSDDCLHGPGLNDLGVIGIVIGLYLVVTSPQNTVVEVNEEGEKIQKPAYSRLGDSPVGDKKGIHNAEI